VGITKNGMRELLGIWNPELLGFKEAFYTLKQRGLNSIFPPKPGG
jgi:transposase-like protein